jgi:hypothetical protein
MRNFFLCLVLWLATPAWAHSLENRVCAAAPASVEKMTSSQKLCLSFVMALGKVPEAMTGEVLALLTPENLTAMSALTSVWMGSQGVPGVGQAVDAALLTLGVVLMTVQTADLSNALWEYARQSHGAQRQEDLEAAADHLARAIALVGVDVVTLVLTKKVAGRGKQSPPAEPPLRPATPPGTPHIGNPAQVSLPASVHMAADGSGRARSPPSLSSERSVSKNHRLVQVEAWRKPKLMADGRIVPYSGTRNPPHPIPNLGRNRAGKAVTDGKHTVRFDKDGFPEFETRFETLLGDSHMGSGKKELHFRSANQDLFSAIKRTPHLAQELGLSPAEVEALAHAIEAPAGYTWHHHQDVGRMQLVPFDAHRLATPHTGGMAIWGGGHR